MLYDNILTCANVVAGLVHLALEELQAHDGVDGDQKEDEQCNMNQWQHGFENGVHDHLQACEETVRRNQWALANPNPDEHSPGEPGYMMCNNSSLSSELYKDESLLDTSRDQPCLCCCVFLSGILLGTPDTRRRGLRTRKALRAFMSKPPPFSMGTPAIMLIVSNAKVKRLP